MIHSAQPAQMFNFYPFDHDFYNGHALYVYLFGQLPEQTIIRQLDYPRALDILNSDLGQEIVQVLHQTGISCAGKKQEEKEESFLVLNGALLLELSFNYCIIYHATGSDKALTGRIKEKLVGVKQRQRRKPMEINIISQTYSGLEFTAMEIKRTRLDVGLYYNDDFLPVDALIRQRLNRKKDKGIVLLHGLPGTGCRVRVKPLTCATSPHVSENGYCSCRRI